MSTQGEQKLLLLARAVAGGPRLALLDEACQGLDYGRRRAALDFLAAAGRESGGACALVHVSHHPDELAALGLGQVLQVRAFKTR